MCGRARNVKRKCGSTETAAAAAAAAAVVIDNKPETESINSNACQTQLCLHTARLNSTLAPSQLLSHAEQ